MWLLNQPGNGRYTVIYGIDFSIFNSRRDDISPEQFITFDFPQSLKTRECLIIKFFHVYHLCFRFFLSPDPVALSVLRYLYCSIHIALSILHYAYCAIHTTLSILRYPYCISRHAVHRIHFICSLSFPENLVKSTGTTQLLSLPEHEQGRILTNPALSIGTAPIFNQLFV